MTSCNMTCLLTNRWNIEAGLCSPYTGSEIPLKRHFISTHSRSYNQMRWFELIFIIYASIIQKQVSSSPVQTRVYIDKYLTGVCWRWFSTCWRAAAKGRGRCDGRCDWRGEVSTAVARRGGNTAATQAPPQSQRQLRLHLLLHGLVLSPRGVRHESGAIKETINLFHLV